MQKTLCALCALLCAVTLATPAGAAAVESGDCYCFGVEDFTPGESKLAGICITQLPEAALGSVMLGDRRLRPGDVLTAEQVGEMTFVANSTEADVPASITYLPVFANGLSGEATMTLSIRGRENKAPIAEDSAFETYRNLEVNGRLRVRDPEAQAMQFTITRQPRRGTIAIHEDGSFTYSPKKNKVGIDSFTFTASDAAGKVSREATVTVTILKPSDARQYADTAGKSCRFAAEWMKNTGIFIGESIGGSPCFSPDKPVTRGEFLTMLVKSLNIPVEEVISEAGYQDAPDWLKPYLAAALRSGLLSSLPVRDSFGADEPIAAEEAAAMLCAGLRLHSAQQAVFADESSAAPLSIAQEHGFELAAGQLLRRADAAQVLYRASQMPLPFSIA